MKNFTPDKVFFQFIFDRLVDIHGENPNMDYMISLKERISKMPNPNDESKPTHFEA